MTFGTFCSYFGCIFVGIAGLIVLFKIGMGHIDLSFLISEKVDGVSQASMSRFQLLIFTFVIAFSLLTIVDRKKDALPEIPSGVLTLLGISASTYAVGKGIQHGTDSRQHPVSNPPNPPHVGPGGAGTNVAAGGNNPGVNPAAGRPAGG